MCAINLCIYTFILCYHCSININVSRSSYFNTYARVTQLLNTRMLMHERNWVTFLAEVTERFCELFSCKTAQLEKLGECAAGCDGR